MVAATVACSAPPSSSRSATSRSATSRSSTRRADRRALTLEHLWLADAVARRFHGRGEDEDDLRQVARCGLLEATQRYDPEHGPFAPYAVSTISGVLKHHFRDRCWVVRPPRDTQQLAVRITQQWCEIAQQRRSVPSDRELADGLGEPVAAVREARRASEGYRTVPLDETPGSLACMAVEDPGFDRCEAKMLVAWSWRLLDQGERDLLRMRFWERRSQADIAQRLGTSQMQVSRMLQRILIRLRERLTEGTGEVA